MGKEVKNLIENHDLSANTSLKTLNSIIFLLYEQKMTHYVK